MKKLIVSAVVLTSTFAFAQENDTINKSKDIEGVIIDAFIKKDSDYSNKMPLKAIEDPQVLSSISYGAIENQLIYTVDDAYRNITGLQKMWNATSRAGDGGSFVILRGFVSSGSMRNGLVAPVTTTVDAINLEKLEILKGPSGTLYGSNVASYGGLVNRVTKKPYGTLGGNVSITGGGYNTYRAQADVNAPLTTDKKLLLRVNTAYTNSGTFQKSDAKNTYFAFTPSLTYNATDKLQFNVEYEMFNNRAIGEQLFFYLSPAPGMLNGIDNMKDLEKAGLNYKQSFIGDGLYTTARVNNLFGQINYKINDHIKSSTNINNSHSYSDGFGPYFGTGMVDNQLFIQRFDQGTRDSKKSWFQVQQNFNFDYTFSNGMRNRTVAGFDYLKTKDRSRFIYLAAGAFDTVPANGYDYSGFNGDAMGALYNDPANLSNYDIDSDLNTFSGYVSNVFTPVAGLNVVLGLRYENNDFKGGKVWINETDPYNQSAWSPKAGLVYEIVKDKFSVFGNYQNSFKSNGYYTFNAAGETALSDPERANQFEGGFKTNLINGKINATVSYYDITAKNYLVTTGYFGNIAIQNQTGEINSKGVELEVNAYLVKGFSLIAGLAYNDTKDKSTGFRPSTAGSKWLANFNASYQFLDGSLKGLGFGVGGNYASDNKVLNQFNTTTNVQDTFTLNSFFVLNANAYYDTKKFRIGVKVDNFTNQHYWIGYSTANPQSLINALGSITYKF